MTIEHNGLLQKEFTRKIIDSLPLSLYVVDRDLNIILWNSKRAMGEFGKIEKNVLGKNISEVINSNRIDTVKKELLDVINSGKPISYERESPEPERKGKKIFRVTRTPIFGEAGQVTAVISIGEDTTEKRMLEQRLIESDRLSSIERLAAGVAHEINNPLAAISGCAEALIGRLKKDEYQNLTDYDDILEYLRIIVDEVYRCKKITGNLLGFARRGEGEIRHQEINTILNELLNLFIYQRQLQSIQVVKEYSPKLPNVLANDGDLRQVFLTIILNAIDAMENGGRLEIKTYQEENYVKIQFKDTGCGIPVEYINRIFDPFLQQSRQIKEQDWVSP